MAFGRYQLVRRIASGGMGEVFQARATGVEGFERLIALKRIFPHLGGDESYRRLFIREAKVTARLIHPNIVQVYDLGEENGQLFIAMELVRGPDLGHLIAHFRHIKQRMKPAVAAVIAFDVLEALDFAHNLADEQDQALNIVHRDISPQNILLASPTGIAKLCDFGVVHASRIAEDSMEGRVVGKMCYMAPEQALSGPIDGRADIYAVGAVLFESVTGRRVVDIRRTQELLEFARGREAPRLADIAPNVPPAFATIVDRALARDVAERFQSAAECRDAIEAFLLLEDPRAARSELRDLVRQFDDTVIALTPTPMAINNSPTTRWQDLETRVARVSGPLVTPTPTPVDGPRPPVATQPPVIGEEKWPLTPVPLHREPTSVTLRWFRLRQGLKTFMANRLEGLLRLSEQNPVSTRSAAVALLLLSIVAVGMVVARWTRKSSAVPISLPAPPPPPDTVPPRQLVPVLGPLPADPVAAAPVEPSTPAAEPPPDAGAAPEARADNEAAAKPEVEKSRPRTDRPKQAAPRPAAATKAPPAAAREGYLNLNVRPWAHVFVDGQPLNKSTPLINHPLAAGRHVVLLKGPDGQERSVVVHVLPGKTVTKILEF
ncbi:MAG: serine/threonine protein kinase [Deltaproteobacteria bacterium]|nr:serine/threonine protein kinase [Deltaproteobacteria bacterium]